jgi:DNA primase small subunit
MEMLRVYYDRLFPISAFFHWLSYGNVDSMKRREITFWMPADKGSGCLRYLVMPTKEAFKRKLLKQMPVKVDFGAIYNASPEQRKSVKGFAPEQKELVFDIDMTDYDEVRTCCQKAGICLRCWTLMSCAIKVMHEVLSKDFGFKHMLWVFSGRRGIHCWVADERARTLSQTERSAVASYMAVNLGTDRNRDVQLYSPLHPSLSRAYDTLLPIFEEYVIPDQKLLATPESCEKILGFIDPAYRNEFGWNTLDKDPVALWFEFKKKVEQFNRTPKSRKAMTLLTVPKIVFYYCYPRLDIEVSKHMNHLLKSPFSVHPKTGKVCVPIDPANCESFDPINGVPTLKQLVTELQNIEVDAKDNSQRLGKSKQWTQTCLKKYREMFNEFVKPLGMMHTNAQTSDPTQMDISF